MSEKKSKSPQQKKALSYAKDRCNTYGENDKASRKLIPLRKAQESRQDRRKVAQELSGLSRPDEEAAATVESLATHDVHRVGGWRKDADAPLGGEAQRPLNLTSAYHPFPPLDRHLDLLDRQSV